LWIPGICDYLPFRKYCTWSLNPPSDPFSLLLGYLLQQLLGWGVKSREERWRWEAEASTPLRANFPARIVGRIAAF
jgi:hypothetical protein